MLSSEIMLFVLLTCTYCSACVWYHRERERRATEILRQRLRFCLHDTKSRTASYIFCHHLEDACTRRKSCVASAAQQRYHGRTLTFPWVTPCHQQSIFTSPSYFSHYMAPQDKSSQLHMSSPVGEGKDIVTDNRVFTESSKTPRMWMNRSAFVLQTLFVSSLLIPILSI